MNFFRIWIISSLIIAGSLIAIAIYDPSAFVLTIFAPIVMLISASFLGLLILPLRILGAKSPISWLIPYGAAVALSLYLLWGDSQTAYIHSDPENDFKRFVMGGPHWPDQDAQQKYNVNEHPLPNSVRVIKSKTFQNFDAEGAAVYFEIDKKDLGLLLAQGLGPLQTPLTPSMDPRDFQALNMWAGWYLWVNTNDLGPSPSLYVARNGGIETWLMAVNHDQTRALFLYSNVN